MFKWMKNPIYLSVFFIAVCTYQAGFWAAKGHWIWALIFFVVTALNASNLPKLIKEELAE
jgi:4-amino-4-deoxy-L-arabinose transferase-like glycosyltransferase